MTSFFWVKTEFTGNWEGGFFLFKVSYQTDKAASRRLFINHRSTFSLGFTKGFKPPVDLNYLWQTTEISSDGQVQNRLKNRRGPPSMHSYKDQFSL